MRNVCALISRQIEFMTHQRPETSKRRHVVAQLARVWPISKTLVRRRAANEIPSRCSRQGKANGNRVLTNSATALSGLLLALFAISSIQQATAVPYAVRDNPFPYDPDWPAVSIILNNKCTDCHRPTTEGPDFTSYQSLLTARDDDGAMVMPGNADDSPLALVVDWNVEHLAQSELDNEPQMPPKKDEWLTRGQIKTIRRWINNGAHEFVRPDCCADRPLIESDFPSARQCSKCHPKQYREWSRSMHAYAQHSPVFEAFNQTLQERTGGTIGTFCTRCHTQVGTALGENGLRRNVNRSQIAMEGVTCVTCHRRQHRHYKASTRVAIEPGGLYETCIYGPFENPVAGEVGSHPAAKNSYLKSSQFCGECHDVTMPGGIRLEEAFSEWQNSPAADAGITCQQCHMGPVQGIPIKDCERPMGRAAVVPGVNPDCLPLRHLTDHTFAGPDYSLLPDTEFPHKLDWMYEKDYRNTSALTAHEKETLTDLRKRNRKQLRIADIKRYELLKNAAEIHVHHAKSACCGKSTNVQVEVKSKFAGHNFPTGFTAERQLWVSLSVCDPHGRIVFETGNLDKNGDLLDDHSREVLSGHRTFDRHLLNFQSKFITLTNKGTERSVVISVNRHLEPLNVLRPADGISASFGRPPTFRISKGNLPPLQSAVKNYPIPLMTPGTYRVHARLNFRHLPPTLLDHIGTPHLKHLLEVVVIDQQYSVIHVTN